MDFFQDDDEPVEVKRHVPQAIRQFADLYLSRVKDMSLQVSCQPKKRTVQVDELNSKQLRTYNKLLKSPSLQDDIVWMLSHNTNKISGRVMDALMTKYPNKVDAHYYIDVTDSPHTEFIAKEDYQPNNHRHIILFSLTSSYKSQMRRYSKAFFDPFGRGVNVMHPLGNGQYLDFSMCKLIFYQWARKNHVFDFLNHYYDDVVSVQRRDQYRQKDLRQQRKAGHKVVTKKRSAQVIQATVCPMLPMKRVAYPALDSGLATWFKSVS